MLGKYFQTNFINISAVTQIIFQLKPSQLDPATNLGIVSPGFETTKVATFIRITFPPNFYRKQIKL